MVSSSSTSAIHVESVPLFAHTPAVGSKFKPDSQESDLHASAGRRQRNIDLHPRKDHGDRRTIATTLSHPDAPQGINDEGNPMTILKSLKKFASLAAMLLVVAPLAAHAQDKAQDKTHEKKGVTEAELKYQAGASPMAGSSLGRVALSPTS